MELRNVGGPPPTPPVPQNPPQVKPAQTSATRPELTAASPTTQTQDTPAESSSQPSREEIEKSVTALNKFASSINNPMLFSIDEDTGKTVVKIVDSSTQEVIKQIPTEEALSIAKALDKLKGLFIEQKA